MKNTFALRHDPEVQGEENSQPLNEAPVAEVPEIQNEQPKAEN